MKHLLCCGLVLAVSGCANGIPTIMEDQPNVIARRTRKMFIGVPVLLSMEGSYAVLDDRWAVTVSHNEMIMRAQFIEAYYHPTCDIALFRIDDGEESLVGMVWQGEEVRHVGYGVGLPLAVNKGAYVDDVITLDRPDCVQSMTTGVTVQGMSGGGVYNADNELVGVNVGYIKSATQKDGTVHHNMSVFQSLYGVRDWIKKVTGKDYYAK